MCVQRSRFRLCPRQFTSVSTSHGTLTGSCKLLEALMVPGPSLFLWPQELPWVGTGLGQGHSHTGVGLGPTSDPSPQVQLIL